MAEELPREELLRKMLNMTTSDNDGQALVAIRKANALLAAAGWDWDKLLAGKIKIIESPFKNMPNPTRPARMEPVRSPTPCHNWRDEADALARAHAHLAANAAAADAVAASQKQTKPRGLGLTRKNLYGGYCYCCGDYVGNEAGFIMRPRDINSYASDKWAIVCKDCDKHRTNISSSPAPKQTGQTTVNAPAPNLGNL